MIHALAYATLAVMGWNIGKNAAVLFGDWRNNTPVVQAWIELCAYIAVIVMAVAVLGE